MWINCILSIKLWEGSYNLIIIQNYYYRHSIYRIIQIFFKCIEWHCCVQWEIILINIVIFNVLYVFSLVLLCLLMIVQCLDFKSIQLLLLYYYHTLQIMGCKVYTFSWCSIIFIEFRSFVLSKKLKKINRTTWCWW